MGPIIFFVGMIFNVTPLAWAGVILFAGVALFLLWAVPANVAADGRFYTQGLLHDVVGRALAPLEGHGGNPLLWLPFYPVVLLIGLAPWSAFVPAALHAMWRRDRPPSDRDCLLTWWIAGPFVAFSVVATHLPHYILPAWPAVSLAVASVVDSAAAGRTDPPARRWIARGIPLAVVTAVVACVTLTAAPFVLHAGYLLWQSIPLEAAIVVTTALFVYFTHHADDSRAFATCLLAAMLFDAWMGVYWVPGLEAVKPVPRIAALIRARTGGAVPVATYGFGEPSLDFYLGAVPQALETAPAVIVWSNTREPGVLVTTRDLLDRVGRPSSLVEIGSSEGFNVTNGQQVELVALARGVP